MRELILTAVAIDVVVDEGHWAVSVFRMQADSSQGVVKEATGILDGRSKYCEPKNPS